MVWSSAKVFTVSSSSSANFSDKLIIQELVPETIANVCRQPLSHRCLCSIKQHNTNSTGTLAAWWTEMKMVMCSLTKKSFEQVAFENPHHSLNGSFELLLFRLPQFSAVLLQKPQGPSCVCRGGADKSSCRVSLVYSYNTFFNASGWQYSVWCDNIEYVG